MRKQIQPVLQLAEATLGSTRYPWTSVCLLEYMCNVPLTLKHGKVKEFAKRVIEMCRKGKVMESCMSGQICEWLFNQIEIYLKHLFDGM